MISETRKYICKVKDQSQGTYCRLETRKKEWSTAEEKASQLTEKDGWMDGRTDSFEFLSPSVFIPPVLNKPEEYRKRINRQMVHFERLPHANFNVSKNLDA